MAQQVDPSPPTAVTVRGKPLVHIGWVLAADVRNQPMLEVSRAGCRRLEEFLAQQFPEFTWRVDFVDRHRYAPRGALDPLVVLEYGVQEKIAHRWDYALITVTNDLRPRERVSTLGIPSSALETAVLSMAQLGEAGEVEERLVGLALHLLGHLWGLEHEEEGPMLPPETVSALRVCPFPEEQRLVAVDRLDEVADKRLEEQTRNWNRVSFYLKAFLADPKSILIDVIGYKPWRLPFQMGRLTAATAISLVILLLTAEAWEVGVNVPVSRLLLGSLLAIVVATTFVFAGQNLGQIARDVGYREQLTRTRIVTFGTLLLGMIALWLVLFVGTFVVGWLMPDPVLHNWTGTAPLPAIMIARQAAFLAMIGVLAGALGGNLEDEEEFKAGLFFDEET